MAQTEISGQEKSKLLLKIADTYVQNMRKWKPRTYKLKVMGKKDGYNIVIGYLLKDVEDARKYANEHPNIVVSGHYPSEFMLLIDFDKREVVEDFRPGQRERHPRP